MNNYKKYLFGFVFLIILSLGIFLRTHNFEDWLFFQGDQARDGFLVNKVVENGPSWLPLLGPKAGGTYLRLGPIFYYFESASVAIFGNETPATLAYPDLLFSILAIGLFYLFLKEIFPKSWSLALILGYSVCYFAIQYSRFAWNPNSLAFFNLLFFYALFKFFQVAEKKKKLLWSILIGISYGVAGQLHFVSFLIFPIILVFIFAVRKFYFKEAISSHAKYLAMIAFIFLIFSVPMILSDIATQGNNALNFLNSIGKKGSDMGLIGMVKENYFNFSKYFLIILGGLVNIPKEFVYWAGGGMFIGIISGIIAFWKEKDTQKKFMILLVFVWFFSYFLMYITLAEKLQPRHFVVILPLPFVFIGLIAYLFDSLFSFKYKFIIPMLIFAVPIYANALSVQTWFGEMEDSKTMITTPRKSPILKSVKGEMWWHIEQVTTHISKDCEKEIITIIPPKEVYRSMLDYSFRIMEEKREYRIKWGSIDISDKSCYYLVKFTKNEFSDRFGKNLVSLNQKNFGDMAVVRFDITPSNSSVKKIENPFKKKKSASDIKAQEEEEIENDAPGDENDNSKTGTAVENILESVGNIGREDRVFWKDLFN